MVKRREQSKKDALKITVDIFDFRYGNLTSILASLSIDL